MYIVSGIYVSKKFIKERKKKKKEQERNLVLEPCTIYKTRIRFKIDVVINSSKMQLCYYRKAKKSLTLEISGLIGRCHVGCQLKFFIGP